MRKYFTNKKNENFRNYKRSFHFFNCLRENRLEGLINMANVPLYNTGRNEQSIMIFKGFKMVQWGGFILPAVIRKETY